MELYKCNGDTEIINGGEVSLYDICQWIIDNYPSDIFVNKPEVVVRMRYCAKEILSMEKK